MATKGVRRLSDDLGQRSRPPMPSFGVNGAAATKPLRFGTVSWRYWGDSHLWRPLVAK